MGLMIDPKTGKYPVGMPPMIAAGVSKAKPSAKAQKMATGLSRMPVGGALGGAGPVSASTTARSGLRGTKPTAARSGLRGTKPQLGSAGSRGTSPRLLTDSQRAAGKAIARDAYSQVAPVAKKAYQKAAPTLRSAYKQVAPVAKNAYQQVAPVAKSAYQKAAPQAKALAGDVISAAKRKRAANRADDIVGRGYKIHD